MSDFNAAQVLAEAYTLYKKRYDGMGLDFKIAIAQVRQEAEQRGMRLAQEAVAKGPVERGRERVGDILSTAQALHMIDNAIQDRTDQIEQEHQK